jgi:hypothetical protein
MSARRFPPLGPRGINLALSNHKPFNVIFLYIPFGVVMETANLALIVAYLKPTKWDFGRDKKNSSATAGDRRDFAIAIKMNEL